MRKVVDEFGDDRVLLAELGVPLEQTMAYYGDDGGGIQVPFNFELLSAAWDARGIAGYVDRYLAALNLGPDPARPAVPGTASGGRVLVSIRPGRDGEAAGGVLARRWPLSRCPPRSPASPGRAPRSPPPPRPLPLDPTWSWR
jgi:hypothetical protein